MPIQFYKYQSSGNNFILIDNISQKKKLKTKLSQILKHKEVKNSDGLLVLEGSKKYDFELIFFNPDGSKSFCGNGSLCSLHYLRSVNKIQGFSSFFSYGRKYTAQIDSEISIKMKDIKSYDCFNNEYFINSGAPHHVKFVDDVKKYNINEEADSIRNRPFYRNNDCNVNLVSVSENNSISIRTFEKGVERETLSCGTGAVASAVAYSLHKNLKVNKVKTIGGELNVFFNRTDDLHFFDIFLKGNPSLEYKGWIYL